MLVIKQFESFEKDTKFVHRLVEREALAVSFLVRLKFYYLGASARLIR